MPAPTNPSISAVLDGVISAGSKPKRPELLMCLDLAAVEMLRDWSIWGFHGVSIVTNSHGGTPIAGWFTRESLIQKWMMTGVAP